MRIDLARYISVLSYIRARGTVQLGELARHYNVGVREMYSYLWTLYMLEIMDTSASYVSPFSLSLENVDPADDHPDPQMEISLDAHYIFDKADAFSTTLSFAELIALLATIDSLLYTAEPETADQLLALRAMLVSASVKAGYHDEMWPAPVIEGGRDVQRKIRSAIANRRYVTIEYWKAQGAGAASTTAYVIPLYIEAKEHPLLRAANAERELRTFRMDRISAVEISHKKLGIKAFGKLTVQAKRARPHFDGEEVRLYCDVDAAWLVETIPGAQAYRADDELMITLHAGSIEWLRTLAARIGPSLHRVEPQHIADALAANAATILQAYQDEA
ncbi:MAG: WYL domain-containing protein [Actinomycetaceae bacterium]|nr:WYL domain-containing protein [Arcanobacterium sp.]MDD7505750.1 WYL domain-containing protein [Actinomycetaceae bacterium]MDY6143651.1 WYL domain-containing protein [Arcanobacterium sp.]